MEGNNPNLKPETAKSWTTGFDWVPDFDPELALSLTYYSVDYTGQIAIPDFEDPFNILQGNEWAAVITRNPSATQIAAVCNRPDYYGSVAACLASSPAVIVDYRLANLSSTRTNGLDLNVHQKFTSDVGLFNLSILGNYVFHFDQQVTGNSPTVDILNTFQNPLKFRFRAVAAWDRHLPEESGLGGSLAVNFTNGYSNSGNTLLPEIGSLTTFDMQLRYHAAEDSGWLGGMDFAINAVNVFNQSPPFADTDVGYDSANFQSLGRVLSLTVSKKW
jgi:iron complex outermembrane receptor protein